MSKRRVGPAAENCPVIPPVQRRHAAASRGRTGRRAAGGAATTSAGRGLPPMTPPGGPFDPDAVLIRHCEAFIQAWDVYNTEGGLLDCEVCPLWRAVDVERTAILALRATTLAGVLAKCRVARSLATQPDGLDYDSAFTGTVPGEIIEDLLRLAPSGSDAGGGDTGGGGNTLLALLAVTRSADAAHAAACGAGDDDATEAAGEDLAAAITAMAGTPADSLRGLAAKAARLCDSLAGDGVDGEPGHTIMPIEEALVSSLAADIDRLIPEARRPDASDPAPAA